MEAVVLLRFKVVEQQDDVGHDVVSVCVVRRIELPLTHQKVLVPRDWPLLLAVGGRHGRRGPTEAVDAAALLVKLVTSVAIEDAARHGSVAR